MPSRLTSNHFVGRVGELAELELAVREATAGRPTIAYPYRCLTLLYRR